MAAERTCSSRLDFARDVTASVVGSYWNLQGAILGADQTIRPAPVPLHPLAAGQHLRFAECCLELPQARAFFEIGELLTDLLPEEFRTKHGVYYTPPALVSYLLGLTAAEGVDWRTARVLDPACGGAAFLAYLAEKILAQTDDLPVEKRLLDLEERLTGLEIDPFAAWLSAVLVDVVVLPLTEEAGRPLRNLVQTGDALQEKPALLGRFDLVVGNPPYGKVSLDPSTRSRFERSLFGHANLYGLFTDMALRCCRPGGVVGFVTPTSFLGGEYFKRLRRLLATEAPLVRASFVRNRDGVFSGVLQETMLAIFRKGQGDGAKRPVAVEAVHAQATGELQQESLGTCRLGSVPDSPWLLPRSRTQAGLVRTLNRLPARLADYGYRVATGQLVWNRHRAQLRAGPGKGHYPIVWAEAVLPDGSFSFRAESRNHQPFLKIGPDQDFLINYEPCVLVQRTTAKEQSRRLIATAIPNDFIIEHDGYIVENHVNMIVPVAAAPAVSLALLARLLNTRWADEAFRCISGSVAVSAFELESLPLPTPGSLLTLSASRLLRLPPVRFEALLEELADAR